MRISADIYDSGYTNYIELGNPIILLDGEDYSNKQVITADDSLGFITRYVTDIEGKLLLNNTREGILTETLYGEVILKND